LDVQKHIPPNLNAAKNAARDKLVSDNEGNFSDFSRRKPATPMAEPKKETVRTALPPELETEPGPQNGAAKPDPAGIVLPSRAPAVPPRRTPPTIKPSSSFLQTSTQPGVPESLRSSSEPVGTENFGGASIEPGPKKDTARISNPSRPAAVITKTPPVGGATFSSADAFDSIPRWLCWGLLSISALIFLIQIWNYAVS
jgi:hypothetical protein